MDPKIAIEQVSVPDLRVASLEFVGSHAEIADRFARLAALTGSRAWGTPFCLYHRGADDHPSAERHLEVCLPIHGAYCGNPGVTERVIPGGTMLSVRCNAPRAAWGPAAWWRSAGDHLERHGLETETLPFREVCATTHGTAAGRPESHELLLPLMRPAWFERFSRGLAQQVERATRDAVLGGLPPPDLYAPPPSTGAWLAALVARLELHVDSHPIRLAVLSGCAHTFPRPRIPSLRSTFEAHGIDAVLQRMAADRSDGGRSYYSDPVRAGTRVIAIKRPANPEEARRAGTENARRAARCHCGLIRAAVARGVEISPTFCLCGTGWYQQLWEGICRAPVEVTVLDSVLAGSDRCRFEIRLPRGIL